MYKLSSIKAKANSLLDGYKQQDPAAYAAAQEAVGGLLILDGFIGIDNPLGGKKRPGIFGSFFGIIFGIVFIIIGFYGPRIFGVNNMTAQTTATVVSIGAPSAVTRNSDGTTSGGTCSLTAKYTVNGQQYTTPSHDSSTSYCSKSVGLTLAINYDPDAPGTWSSDVAMIKWIFKAFVAAGILFVIVSFFTFCIRLASIIFGWKLLRSGRALAKTLPGGASLGNLVKDIRTQFSHVLFGNTAPIAAAPASQPTPSFAPPQPAAPLEPTQPLPTATPAPMPAEQPQQTAPVVPEEQPENPTQPLPPQTPPTPPAQ